MSGRHGHQQPASVFGSEIRNRFLDGVYREQAKRGLGPYSRGQQAYSHHDQKRTSATELHNNDNGSELKRTRNLFEERVRLYLGRGSTQSSDLDGSMSQVCACVAGGSRRCACAFCYYWNFNRGCLCQQTCLREPQRCQRKRVPHGIGVTRVYHGTVLLCAGC
jgi:hypothetical protein